MALLQRDWAGHLVERATKWRSGRSVQVFMVAMVAISEEISKSLAQSERPSSWLPISAQSVKQVILTFARQAIGVVRCLASTVALTTQLWSTKRFLALLF